MIGVLVLYNPDNNLIDNIKSYINNLDHLLVYDNSEISYENKLPKTHKIIYHHFPANLGLSIPYNKAIKYAINNDSKYLLVMDQDSSFRNDDFLKMKKMIINEQDKSKYCLFSPLHSDLELEVFNDFPFFSLVTMNSGSVLNIESVIKIGKYDENLFVDCVDTEFCLRAAKHGLIIKRFSNITINHNCGDINKKFGFTLTNHSPIRRYYMIKNRLYVWNKYPQFNKFINYEKKSTIKDIIKIILFENNKIQKLIMMTKGLFDYIKKKYGKYEI